jgi:carbon-monoxide dehydrogenase small subunit
VDKINVTFIVNGERVELSVKPERSLLDVLRMELDLTGAKAACEDGQCGACKVIIDGNAVVSCLVPMRIMDGKSVQTIEGLAIGTKLHPIQQAFMELGGVQCGYCNPGMIMAAKALLDRNPTPTEREVRLAISGNLCRCTGYKKQVEAILLAANRMRGLV